MAGACTVSREAKNIKRGNFRSAHARRKGGGGEGERGTN